jgi:hypothetical protein
MLIGRQRRNNAALISLPLWCTLSQDRGLSSPRHTKLRMKLETWL